MVFKNMQVDDNGFHPVPLPQTSRCRRQRVRWREKPTHRCCLVLTVEVLHEACGTHAYLS